MDEPDEDAVEARQRRQSTVEEREARVQALLAAALPSPASARRASSSWAEPRRSQGGEARRSAAPRLSEPSPRRLSEARVSASSAGRRERRSSAASAARSNAWDTPRESDEGAQGGGDDTAQSAERLPEALVEAHARVAGERAELDAKLAAVQREAAALRADRDALDADRRAFEACFPQLPSAQQHAASRRAPLADAAPRRVTAGGAAAGAAGAGAAARGGPRHLGRVRCFRGAPLPIPARTLPLTHPARAG
jgi:colicin import membrane protein